MKVISQLRIIKRTIFRSGNNLWRTTTCASPSNTIDAIDQIRMLRTFIHRQQSVFQIPTSSKFTNPKKMNQLNILTILAYVLYNRL